MSSFHLCLLCAPASSHARSLARSLSRSCPLSLALRAFVSVCVCLKYHSLPFRPSPAARTEHSINSAMADLPEANKFLSGRAALCLCPSASPSHPLAHFVIRNFPLMLPRMLPHRHRPSTAGRQTGKAGRRPVLHAQKDCWLCVGE